MRGEIYHNADGTDVQFGAGLAHESWTQGRLAYMDIQSGTPEYKTFKYDADLAKSANHAEKPSFLSPPVTDPAGHGETWGQEMRDDDGDKVWCIHNYNDDVSDDWSEGIYHFYYFEANESTGYYAGFEQDIDI